MLDRHIVSALLDLFLAEIVSALLDLFLAEIVSVLLDLFLAARPAALFAGYFGSRFCGFCAIIMSRYSHTSLQKPISACLLAPNYLVSLLPF